MSPRKIIVITIKWNCLPPDYIASTMCTKVREYKLIQSTAYVYTFYDVTYFHSVL